MKNIYTKLLVFALILISNTLTAQEFKKDAFGIRAGANMSNLHTLNNTPEPFAYDTNYKTGFYAGIFGELSLTQSSDFAIHIGVDYSQEGYKKSFITENGQENKVNYNLNMIKIPVLLKYYICNQFSVILGPQVGFFGKEKWKFKNESLKNPSNVTSSELKDSDFSVVSGFSFNTKSGLSVDFRYNHGIKSIYKNTENITTRNFQLGLSYKF
nr:porin family protein [uncultured Flavobacterium sp.]